MDLGRRLRHLYVDQLHFLPDCLTDPNTIYLRSSHFPRALHSLLQVFTGIYPSSVRSSECNKPTVVTSRPSDETLLPNEEFCPRFIELIKAYSDRTAKKCRLWIREIYCVPAELYVIDNQSDELKYLNGLLRKWMPAQQRVSVDSSPTLHGILDTINTTHAASDARTRLPEEFYDEKARDISNRITIEEEYQGYSENAEYRTLGIGRMLGDAVQRMVNRAQDDMSHDQWLENASHDPDLAALALFGCHDSTIAATLISLGALKVEAVTWPAFSSSMAIELFRVQEEEEDREVLQPLPNMSSHYVRIRYNDRPVTLPGCQRPGHHLKGDLSFCTLVSVMKR